MFRSIVFAVTIAVCLTDRALAQDSLVVRLPKREINLPGRDFYIDSVIDNRITRHELGEARVGITDRRVPVYFAQPFDVAIKDFFDINVTKSHGQMPLIAVVNSLHVYEEITGMSSRGVVRVDVSFCRWKSDTLRIVARASKYLYDDKMDATNSHGKRVAEAFAHCVTYLYSTAWKTNPGSPLELGNEMKPGDNEHNILKAEKKASGVYLNFNELRSNSPGNHDELIVSEPDDRDHFMVLYKNTKRRVVEPFGFSDGTDIFINTCFYQGYNVRGVFARVNVTGPYLAWYDAYRGDPTALGIALGVLGSTQARSTTGAVAMDLRTGIIFPLQEETMMKILEDEPALLEEFKKIKKKTPDKLLTFLSKFNALHPDL